MKKNLSASFTIEAAILYPLLLFFLFQFILLLFTMHDSVVKKSLDYRYTIAKEMQEQKHYSYQNSFLSSYTTECKNTLLLKKHAVYSIEPTLTNTTNISVLYTYQAEKKITHNTGGSS